MQLFAFQLLIDILFRFNVKDKLRLPLRRSASAPSLPSQSDGEHKSQQFHPNCDTPYYQLNEVQLTLLKYLPLRAISRLWGLMTSLYLPTCLRPSILGSYSRLFNCQLKEAEIDDYRLYPNLRQFFTRSLKPGLRPIASGDNLVSPVDGTVLHFGSVKEGNIEQIKGVKFTTRSFLGPQTWKISKSDNSYQPETDPTSIISSNCDTLINYTSNLKLHTDNCLYNCVIYLAPGDYHRFHSPAQWKVHFRRHFPGYLLSVHPSFVGRVKGLFTINERVSYLGSWAHGFFSMTAVGATNVGSVKTYFDPKLKTNQFNWRSASKPYNDEYFEKEIRMDKGDPFGHFNLGSTVVLLFEAPRKWKFNVKPGDKIKYGQMLFSKCN